MREDDDSIVIYDFSSSFIPIERIDCRLFYDSCAASDITLDDSSSDHSESSSESEDEVEGTYVEYQRMMMIRNQANATRKQESSKVFSSSALWKVMSTSNQNPVKSAYKNRWRVNRDQISRALEEPPNLSCHPPTVPKRLPFLEDSFATQQTASMNSIGSEGAHRPTVGQDWANEPNNKRDKAMVPPKRIASMEEEHSPTIRSFTRTESKPQAPLKSKGPMSQASFFLLEI
jgi:hypothetical protein